MLFFISNAFFFNSASQCCSTVSWIKLQMLLRCCVVQIAIIIYWDIDIQYRNGPRRCYLRKGVHRNFAKFTGEYLCQSLIFNKVAGLWHATLLKMRLWHGCFPANFAKFLRTLFFIEHLRATTSVSIFMSMSRPKSIYVVSIWSVFHFQPYFHFD